jgi:hypothetical protein
MLELEQGAVSHVGDHEFPGTVLLRNTVSGHRGTNDKTYRPHRRGTVLYSTWKVRVTLSMSSFFSFGWRVLLRSLFAPTLNELSLHCFELNDKGVI